MKFKFRLEALLKHRKHIENEAQRQFVESRFRLDQAKVKLQSMYGLIDRCRFEISNLQGAGKNHDLMKILEREAFIKGQEELIKRHREHMRELQLDLEEKQEALVLALRDRKTIEKLKEKRKQEHDKEVARREALEMDEIATIRAGGRR